MDAAPLPDAPRTSALNVVALILSVVGLCCPPLPLVGIILGIISVRRSRRDGASASVAAILAIVFGGLGLLTSGAAVAYGLKVEHEREQQANALKGQLGDKLTAAHLTPAAACDLAQLYLVGVKKDALDGFLCSTAFQDGAVPRLTDVTYVKGGEPHKATFCFARARRWFVVSTPPDGVCPSAVDAPPTGDGVSVEDEEADLRSAETKRRSKGVLDTFLAQIKHVRDNSDREHHKEPCPALDKAVKATYVDFDLLPGVSQEQPWKMLSHEDMRAALDNAASFEDRAAAVDRIRERGAHVVVFTSDKAKALPEVRGKSYTMGAFDGWATVLDLSSGKALCEAPLLFESSEKVGGGIKLKYMPDKSTEQMVQDDFEKKFENAATDAMRSVSQGNVKLGLKLLE